MSVATMHPLFRIQAAVCVVFPPGAAHPVFYGDGLVRDLCAVSRGKDAHHRGQDAAIVPTDAILQRITQIDGGFRYFYRIDILEK